MKKECTEIKNISNDLQSAINYLYSNNISLDDELNTDIKLKAVKEDSSDKIIGQYANLSKISFGDGKKLDKSKI